MDTLFHAALSNAVLASVLAMIAALFGLVCRNAAWRHSLWLLVLLKLLTPPLVELPGAWPIGISLSTSNPARLESGLITGASPANTSRQSPQVHQAKSTMPPNSTLQGSARLHADADRPASLIFASRLDRAFSAIAGIPATTWWAIAAWVWLAGSAAWFSVAIARIARFQHWLRHATPAPPAVQSACSRLAKRLGLKSSPQVLLISAAVSPLLWAFGRRQVIVLPSGLPGQLTDEELHALLLHELAHLRRNDHWLRLVELAVSGLYWWHPAVWWARREMRQAEEQCCDAWVVWARPESADVYALALVRTLEYLAQVRASLTPLASGVGHLQQLKSRLQMIIGQTTPRQLGRWGRLGVALCAAIGLPWCFGTETSKAVSSPPRLLPQGPAPQVSAKRARNTTMPAKRTVIPVVRSEPPSLEQAYELARSRGKYRMLLAQFAAPDETSVAGDFQDLGYQMRTSWAGRDNLPAGYWVYVRPYWYIWQTASHDLPARPWGPEQATGQPNTVGPGDLSTAWASLCEDDQDEWLLVEFEHPVVPTELHVYETLNSGALHRVTLFHLDGSETVAWEGDDPTPPGSGHGISRIPVSADSPVCRVKLHLGSRRVSGWNEIDAVGLLDSARNMQWATAAHASSAYANVQTVVVRTSQGMLARPQEYTVLAVSPEVLARAGQRLAVLEEELRVLKQDCRELAKMRHAADEICRLLNEPR